MNIPGLQLVAFGTLDQRLAAGAGFVGPRQGFLQTGQTDNGTGDWTVTTEPSNSSFDLPPLTEGGFYPVATVIPAVGAAGTVFSVTVSMETANTFRIRAYDAAGMLSADATIALAFYRPVNG